jgi:EAL domain-containing protein (putative c-di-GMP-specific phosphodiesterase class I)
LFREADTALTEAKQRGGARNVAFEPGLRAASRHRRELAADLGAAIAAGQLRVVYQPLVDLATGRTRGFEALVRWTHPRHGVVPPSVFVPVAEDRGTVADIGRFVLATALAQLQVFDREHPAGCGEEELEISVNLSGRHLVAPGLVAEVADALARSGTAPHRLCLEVTESAVVSDLELASATLAQLRTLGVRIALDDFGTGYSSLSYLRRLPVDVLKIDKSFVDDVADVTAAALLQGIASMSSALGLLTVAEGIETGVARDRVRAAGCTWGQGYFFDRPLDAEEALRHLARDREPAARRES